jgi:N-acetylglucosaminyl-diphospho-decaprenol L-rhamnosyltransferase
MENIRLKYDILISIINFRTADLTIACAKSVLTDLEEAPHIKGLVVIVDNRSGDGSAEEIARWLETAGGNLPIRLVLSETNSGFSGGHNQGIAADEAEFYLPLNSDAVLTPGFIPAIVETARAHPRCGLIAPQIDYDDGGTQDSCFRFPSPMGELVRSARSSPVTRLFKKHDTSLGPYPAPDQIEWASFACILLRADMIREIGMMDEGYFMYFEDAEYCLRARRAGWSIKQNQKAVVIHFRGGSGPVKSLIKERARLPRYFYSSRTRFLYQAHGRIGLFLANLVWYLGRGIKHATRLFGKPVHPLPRGQGRDIWTNFINPMGRRHAPDEK